MLLRLFPRKGMETKVLTVFLLNLNAVITFAIISPKGDGNVSFETVMGSFLRSFCDYFPERGWKLRGARKDEADEG